MTLKRLATSVLIAALGLAGVTHWRASAREVAAEAAFPASGQFVTVEGKRLHYEIKGEGPDLVMIHGASGSLRDLTFALRDRLTDGLFLVPPPPPPAAELPPIELRVAGEALPREGDRREAPQTAQPDRSSAPQLATLEVEWSSR